MLNPFFRLFVFSLAYLAKPFLLNKTLILDWLIDWYNASLPPGSSSSAIFSKLIKTIQKNKRRGSTASTNFDCHWKSLESWVGSKNLIFCSGYSTLTLFRNLQKKSLPCRKRDSSVNGRFRIETTEVRRVHVHSSLLVVTSNQNASNKKRIV